MPMFAVYPARLVILWFHEGGQYASMECGYYYVKRALTLSRLRLSLPLKLLILQTHQQCTSHINNLLFELFLILVEL